MTRARVFSKDEIMDVAQAAAATGLSAKLHPTGEIIFTNEAKAEKLSTPTPEDVLEEWLKGRR